MGLFDKKFCDICGEKTNLLTNRKLEDGNMCSKCTKLISPFFSGRKQTTVADMKEHLAYREANKEKIATFNISQEFGDNQRIFIDNDNKQFAVTFFDKNSWEKENPDIIPLSEVKSCNLKIDEEKEELFIKDAQGNQKSYNPPKYKYYYEFTMCIELSSRWFDEIKFRLDREQVEGLNSTRYHKYEMMGNEIIAALTGKNVGTTHEANFSTLFGTTATSTTVTVNQDQSNEWTCSKCNSKNTGNFCQNCGAKKDEPIRIKCDKCGWTPEDNSNIPNFCPNCGDPINKADIE